MNPVIISDLHGKMLLQVIRKMRNKVDPHLLVSR